MSEKHITRTVRYGADEVPNTGRTDWARLRAMSEEEIEAAALADDDNPPMTEEELAAGEVVLPSERRGKVPISIRMDEYWLERFKAKGPRYQTRLNELMVADSQDRVLLLDECVAEAYAQVKSRGAVMNAILRQRAPTQGAAKQWSTGAVAAGVQRASTVSKGEWAKHGDVVRIDVGITRSRRQHAS